MENCSTSLTSEKCKSKPQWGTISRLSEWLLSKSLQTINSGEGEEKREPSYTVGGKYKLVQPLWRTVYRFLQIRSDQSLSRVRLFVTPWIAAHQASLSITNSRSSLRLMSIESVMPSSHLILCRPLLLLSPIPPSIKVFSNESTLRMRWSKC